jgi:alpha-1,3-mannosyltransferase
MSQARNQLKVLQVSHHFKPFHGGIERIVDELSQRLKKNGWRVEIACLDRNPNQGKVLPAEETMDGLKVKRIPFTDLKYYKFAPQILKLVRQSEAEIIHIHNIGFWTDCLLLAKLFGLHDKKVVVSTHGGIFHTPRLYWLKKLYFHGWLRFLFKLADKVVAVSKKDFQDFKGVVAKDKLVLVENGVDLSRFNRLKGRREKDRCLFVGRLSENKRIDRLIEALAGAKGENNLIVVGKDDENLSPGLKKKAKELKVGERVRFTGAVNEKDLLKEYSQAEFFVSASAYEGFGLTAVEAMASGLIPLLNDIPSFRQFVRQGENGFIVDYSSPAKAAAELSRLSRLSAGERKKLSAGARAASQRFDWPNKTKEFERVYQSCLRGRQ